MIIVKLIFFIHVLVASTISVYSQDTQPSSDCQVIPLEDRSYDGIVNYLKDHNFPSIECFLHSIPEDIRARRTYAKRSLSLQAASPTHPRAILASPQGEFFLSFNGHGHQKGYDEIEIMALDNIESPKEWKVTSLRMVNNKLVPIDNRARCIQCHGDPIRPIWNSYPNWPDLYGSIDDWMPDPEDVTKDGHGFHDDLSMGRITNDKIDKALLEREQFLRFRELAKDHPRYSALENVSDPKNPVYPYTHGYRSRNLAYRPNLNIGELLTLQHARVLANTIRENDFLKKYKHTALFGLRCHNILNVDQEKKDKTLSFVAQEYYQLTQQSLDEGSFLIVGALLKLIGLKDHQLTLEFRNDLMNEPIEDVRFSFTGGTSLINQLAGLLTPEPQFTQLFGFDHDAALNILYDDTGLPSPQVSSVHYHSAFMNRDDHQFFAKNSLLLLPLYGHASHVSPIGEICDLWLDRSQEEILDDQVVLLPTPSFRGPYPNALRSCISCHDGASPVGTPIPFSTPELIPSSLKDELEFYLLDLITSKAIAPAHQGGNRMPLGLPALTEEEIQEIKDWLFP